MIVKVRYGNGWKMYEGKEVRWYPSQLGNDVCGPMTAMDDFEIAEYPPDYPTSTGDKSPATEIAIRGYDGSVKIVIARLDVFILNDNGKTVERV